MNLENVKKYAESEIQGYKIAKAVTDIKNEVKDKGQVRDIVTSEHFKSLREPLIEQQKKKNR